MEAEINIKYQGNEYDTKDMILASILQNKNIVIFKETRDTKSNELLESKGRYEEMLTDEDPTLKII